MKVLQVIHDYLPEHVGGTENHAHQLARVLSARGHEIVTLFTERDLRAERGSVREHELDGLRLIECVHQREYSDVAETWCEPRSSELFRAVLEREKPDVVHFQHLAFWGAECLAHARAAGYATVVTLHDFHLLCDRTTLLNADGGLCSPTEIEACRSCLARHPFSDGDGPEAHSAALNVRLAFHRERLRAAQRVIVPSFFLADAMLSAGMVEPDQLIRLKAGYPGPLREPRSPSLEGPLRLGYVGGLYHDKGVHVLVDAMRQLERDSVQLSIHGPLAWFPEYVAQLRSAAEGFDVRFRGRFDPERVDRVLADIDVLVLPSIWYENMPLTLHEAWRNGLPVIATDLGGMAECVTHGTNGLLFPRGDSAALADAIRTLSEDRAFAARLARGRPVLPTVEAVAERVEGIYVACLAALEEERTGGETS